MVATLLADSAGHATGVGKILRLGPLLSVGIVAIAAGYSAPTDPTTGARRTAAVALTAAAALHLALTPEHLRESPAAGAFFIASAIGEYVAAGMLVAKPRRFSCGFVLALVGVLVAVYVAARLTPLPFTTGIEDVDAIGLVTKILEIAAALLALTANRFSRWTSRAAPLLLAGTLLTVAMASRTVFGEGPRLADLALTVGTALAVAVAHPRRSLPHGIQAVLDGAAIALLLRASPLGYLVAVAITSSTRLITRRQRLALSVPPLAAGLVGTLAFGSLGTRLEIWHVGHADEPFPAAVMFVTALALATAAWWSGKLPMVVAFLSVHITGQLLRIWTGHTTIPAVEVPATSLGLLLIAAVALADPERNERRYILIVTGILAGCLDVLFRQLAVPYPPIVAVVVVGALMSVRHPTLTPNLSSLPAEVK